MRGHHVALRTPGGPLAEQDIRIRIATVATPVSPGADEAKRAAEVFYPRHRSERRLGAVYPTV